MNALKCDRCGTIHDVDIRQQHNLVLCSKCYDEFKTVWKSIDLVGKNKDTDFYKVFPYLGKHKVCTECPYASADSCFVDHGEICYLARKEKEAE